MNRTINRANRRLAIGIALAIIAGLSAFPASASQPVLRAGADRSDITPELGTVMPGSFVPVTGQRVHDPLYVRTLVLDDGTNRIAVVVCDIVALPLSVCDQAKKWATELTGLPGSHIVMAATHTHSGGSARRRSGSDSITQVLDMDGFTDSSEPLTPYQNFLARRVADSVQSAIQRLEPARIGWGAGREPAPLFNRRWYVKSELNRRNPFGGVDEVRMNPAPASADLIKPAGPTDPEIVFLSVQSKSGRPIAVLANYSLHYVGGVTPRTFSADYYGMFAERMGEMLGATRQDPPFVAMMSNGTSADVNNINFPQGVVPGEPYVKMRQVANKVAAEVYRAYQSVTYQEWVKIDARYEELPLRPRQPTPEMVAHARQLLEHPPAKPLWHPLEAMYARWLLLSLDAPKTLRVPVQAIRVGNVGIGTVPAETFAEMGLELKARTPFEKSFTMSLANGWFGYMPTAAQHELGGYETWLGVNRLEKEAASKIVSTLLSMMKSMNETSAASALTERSLP
jgi:neutral ceramidase